MESMYNYKTAVLPASFKDADSKKGIVTGYFSSFNNKDSDGDIIVKGAFLKSIEERGPGSKLPRIKHLQNHNFEQPIGRLQLLMEDESGLYYESRIGTHSLGREFIAMVESGLITEHSIGFKTITKEDTKEGTVLRELKLWEGSSLTAWGANEQTPLTGLKASKQHLESLIKQQKTIENFCRNSTASDETIKFFLDQLILINKTITEFFDCTTLPGALSPELVEGSKGDDTTKPDREKEAAIRELNSISELFKTPVYGT